MRVFLGTMMTIGVECDEATASHFASHAAIKLGLRLNLDWQEVFVASHQYGVSCRCQLTLFLQASSLDRSR